MALTAVSKDRIQKALVLIREDINTDVEGIDGMPFNGNVIAEYLGKVYAAIDALAGMLQILTNETESES